MDWSRRSLALAGLAAMSCAGVAAAQTSRFGRFSGNPDVTLLSNDPNGKRIQLNQRFTYWDPTGVEWSAPAGFKCDGASIPQFAWSLTGGPMDGPYVSAAIIHDYYCDVRTRPWRRVHEVFHLGCLALDPNRTRANVMGYMVMRYGPKWDAQGRPLPWWISLANPAAFGLHRDFSASASVPESMYAVVELDAKAMLENPETAELSAEEVGSIAQRELNPQIARDRLIADAIVRTDPIVASDPGLFRREIRRDLERELTRPMLDRDLNIELEQDSGRR